uniref:E3 ubiquitin-protein ligase RNF138 n=1 Tax=Oncorhynchus kisutch TaxID=8019 RepID=A0A8C7IEL2_ONCKI
MNNIWDAAERSLDSCSEEDYDCPICQDVLKTPIRTRNCRHVFCKNCFRLAVRAQGPHCPLCRGPVSETEKRAIDVQQQMRERKGQCRACGTTVADTIYYTFTEHILSILQCYLNTEEGVGNPIASTCSSSPNQHYNQVADQRDNTQESTQYDKYTPKCAYDFHPLKSSHHI